MSNILQLPFSNNLKLYITEQVNRRVVQLLSQLGQDLRHEVPDIDELIKMELYPVHINIRITNKKTRTKKQLPTELVCRARISSGSQCSRPKAARQKYCKAHQQSIPYGSVDDLSTFTRRSGGGRRFKKEETFEIREKDMDKYVQAVMINIGDDRYLLDVNDVLYDENNQIVGILENGEPKWCT